MSTEQARERDLVLPPGQFAMILDETKGNISVYVGPTKTSLANTDRPVVFNPATRRYDKTTLDAAIQEFAQAAEGHYIVLENPAQGKDTMHPPLGTNNTATKLQTGLKVIITGPTSFPLWPGQVATVIEGHRLRSNQYLVGRVYNAEQASANWTVSSSPQPKPQTATADGQPLPPAPPPEVAAAKPTFVIGQLVIIKGTEDSFFIPPTGLEVIKDAKTGNYVREAVSLERLEYCVLVGEDGEKRYERGPDVVFPEPTETFKEVDDKGSLKARAVELNDDMGLYLKVTEDYEDGDKKFVAGEELFITGKSQRIYYPRKEHAIIKYGKRDIHYGVMISKGEGRYVLDKNKGRIELVTGPCILLPDPRYQVIVQRVLSDRECNLLYPSNAAVLRLNQTLRGRTEEGGGTSESMAHASRSPTRTMAADVIAADDFQRGVTYNPPRTITLNTKFDGAVAVGPWTGFAVKVTDKAGGSRIELGPKTVLLDYDETLEILELSMGKPKTTDTLFPTPYLQVLHNQVSDFVTVVTKDMVTVTIKLSYRVNFEGDPNKWFNVKNYVKFLCDHGRSLLKNMAKSVGIEQLNDNGIPLVRDTILGVAAEGEERPGLAFNENGMRAYDLEVLNFEIGDAKIRELLTSVQTDAVRGALDIATQERNLGLAQRKAEIAAALAVLEHEEIDRESGTAEARADAKAKQIALDLDIELGRVRAAAERRSLERETEKMDEDQRLSLAKSEMEQELARIAAEVSATVEKAKAISPQLVAALQTLGDRMLATAAAEKMAPLAILGGESVADVLGRLLKGTALAASLVPSHTNGAALPAGHSQAASIES